jgi:hypothetical protein
MVEQQEQDKKNARVMMGTQCNHGPWTLPASLSHLNSPPLWLAVAWWGALSGKPMTRSDVSETFRITQRRAGDVLNYLFRHCKDTVVCSWKPVKDCNYKIAGSRVCLCIHAVNTTTGKAAKPRKAPCNTLKRTACREREAELNALRKALLTRPAAGQQPDV